MLIPVTLIEEVVGAVLSGDRSDCVLQLRDGDGQELTCPSHGCRT